MAKKINWSEEAITTFNDCLEYLRKDWGEKVVEEFIEKTNEVVKQIAIYPYLFKKYNKHNIREALITKQSAMIYKIYATHIDLITFWDTRQNPRKKKIL